MTAFWHQLFPVSGISTGRALSGNEIIDDDTRHYRRKLRGWAKTVMLWIGSNRSGR